MQRLLKSLLMVAAFSILAAGQQVRITGTKVETLSAASGLQAAIRQATSGAAGPVWIGYAVPIVDSSKPRTMCCGNYSSGESQSCCGSCRLEAENGSYVNISNGGCMQTEPASLLIVMLRYADGKITRTRTMTPGCGVDGTGATVRWLNDVQPAQSVGLLASFVGTETAEAKHVQDTAIMSIALHADPSAESALNRFVGADQPEKIREKTAFWLANERGHSGFLTIQKLAREDKDDRLRKQLAFDLTLTKEPEAVPELIRMAHQDPDGGVRGQALFWMAQKAGKKLIGEIASAAENDPDTEVKKRAVFALSQIPEGEGVPKLIEVARNNRNPAVRKQAVFWLGQSHDPRALTFIEDVLTR